MSDGNGKNDQSVAAGSNDQSSLTDKSSSVLNQADSSKKSAPPKDNILKGLQDDNKSKGIKIIG